MMYRFCKRTFDFFASLFGIIVLLPLLVVIAFIIAVTSKDGVFFLQKRVDKNGKLFKIIKFRSMYIHSELDGQLTTSKDKRITKIGKFIRKAKIDELPQLFNVLGGTMSFVGPRPEVPKYVALYNEEQLKVLSVRPGITDLASIEFRNENELLMQEEDPEIKYIEEIMPKKLELNLLYVKKKSFFYDLQLIFITLWRIIK